MMAPKVLRTKMSKVAATGIVGLALAVLPVGHAFAGDTVASLPAPGILGLVALGVIGAIAIARGRK